MADHFDDDRSFWGDGSRRRSDPTGATPRSGFERTREHKVVTRRTPPPVEAPVVEHDVATEDEHDELWARFGASDAAEPEVDAWVEPERERARPAGGPGIDPRLLRIGALAAATVVLVPVVLAIADGGSGDDVRSSETTLGTIAPAPAQAPATTGVAVTAAATLDPSVEAAEDADDDESAAASSEKGDPGADEPECAGTYTVVAGDYWIRFVDSSGATLDEWLAANDAAPDTELHVGDELCIPAGAQAPTPTVAETAPPEPATPATEAAQVPAPTGSTGDLTAAAAPGTCTAAAGRDGRTWARRLDRRGPGADPRDLARRHRGTGVADRLQRGEVASRPPQLVLLRRVRPVLRLRAGEPEGALRRR